MADALVMGEALVDVVHAADGEVTARPGGSAANVAVALARLGRPVRLATAWAPDEYGDLLARHVVDSGVVPAPDPRVLARTSTALARVGADGSADYEFDLDWRPAPVAADPAPRVVHVCSLGAVVQPGADDVAALAARLRSVASVSYDVNARPSVTGTGPEVRARVERTVALADLVKVSDEDLAVLWPDLAVETAARRLLGLGAGVVVLTRGGAGATWLAPGVRVDAAAPAVRVVDTIGAGDTFAAALLDGLWERGLLGGRLTVPPTTVGPLLAHAGAAAAVTVSRPGADPPYRSELG